MDFDQKVAYLLNLRVHESGPNCFNAALFVNGLTSYINFTTANQFDTFLNSKSCHKIKKDKLQKGDIVLLNGIYPEGILPLHAFVYLENNKYFQKGSPRKKDLFEITTLKKAKDPFVKPGPNNGLEYFRCGKKQIKLNQRMKI